MLSRGPSAGGEVGKAVRVVAEMLAASEGEHVDGADDADVADVVGGESVVGGRL